MGKEHPAASRVKAMFCYAHRDHRLRDDLDMHLAPLKRELGLTAWFDGEILPGSEWDKEISKALDEAHIILLLISARFLDSKYCYDKELARALHRHDAKQACVIPIILEPCEWKKEAFARLEVLPTKGTPIRHRTWRPQAEALFDVARGIRRATERLIAPLAESAQEIVNAVGMKLRLIPAGSFRMGSRKAVPDEQPVETIAIETPFYIGVCQVTQAQYEQVINDMPSRFKGPNRPVETVSWHQAAEFCRKLSETEGVVYRLPTEAEWEYACRAGSTTEYCVGDSPERLKDYAWFAANSDGHTHDVAGRQPNAWGLHDMHGNAWEWCQSLYKPYRYRPDDGREDIRASTPWRVVRGGSWSSAARHCRCAYRRCRGAGDRHDDVGFRVARPLP